MHRTLTILSVVVLGFPFFFWARGLIKSRRDDIILGFSLLIFLCGAGLVLSGSSAVFSSIGVVVMFFGVETLIVSAFAKQDCPISRKDRISLGVGALVAGLFLSMIL